MRFEGKRVVLTGGASGIGKATAEAFIAEGAQVMMGDLNAEAGAAMAAESRYDNRLAFQKTDVTQEADITGLLDAAADHFGGVDILFNNAGAAGARKRIDEISADEWDFTQNLLLRSVALGIRHVVPHMKNAGGGAIVNTASITAHEAGWGPIAYSVAKAGVMHLSKIAAAELAQHNIRVNSISPGFILTNIFADAMKDEGEAMARAVDGAIRGAAPHAQPIHRAGMPDDIAQTVLHLASELGSFITGIDIKVDGGMLVGPRHSWDPDTPGLVDALTQAPQG
jgi:NAD(P)-dependent dehydrogenase (short-subunit alcohol dehydrogenase family)